MDIRFAHMVERRPRHPQGLPRQSHETEVGLPPFLHGGQRQTHPRSLRLGDHDLDGPDLLLPRNGVRRVFLGQAVKQLGVRKRRWTHFGRVNLVDDGPRTQFLAKVRKMAERFGNR